MSCVRLVITPDAKTEIGIVGYGDKTSEEGHGSPIYIEADDSGGLFLYVWADINQEDPTHKISLAGAKETMRDAIVGQCENCGEERELHKVKYEDDSSIGSMLICDVCDQ